MLKVSTVKTALWDHEITLGNVQLLKLPVFQANLHKRCLVFDNFQKKNLVKEYMKMFMLGYVRLG
jgi:hypothetical protein